jgi:hypothetical protein
LHSASATPFLEAVLSELEIEFKQIDKKSLKSL